MATLSEIAEKCGVSTATVSYVLSGKGEEKRISPAMQELVRTTAEQLGYKQRTAGASAPARPGWRYSGPRGASRPPCSP